MVAAIKASSRYWSDAELNKLQAAVAEGIPPIQLVDKFPGRSYDSIRYQHVRMRQALSASSLLPPPDTTKDTGVEIRGDDTQQTIVCRSGTIRTLEGALKEANVDQSIWEVDRYVINKWDCVAKVATGYREEREEHLEATELWQVKIWLRRKTPEVRSIETLLEQLAKKSPLSPRIKRPKIKPDKRHALEINIMDPHFGLMCFPAAADKAWSLDDCEAMCMWAIDGLLELSKPFWPVEEIVFPFGNDFLHSDNVFHTTTAGTAQPEALSWHHVYERGEKLAIAMIERLLAVAPVKVVEVPGNHARQSEFTMARVLRAYYHQNKNVEVDAAPSPYKFWRYGTNLVGYEHGHSISAIRLAAIMAHECRDDWSQTSYREWHLGDQHRKGSAKPSMLEEQGVAIEYLPGLTPPNEWHKLKGFNWQQRGAMGWVWSFARGPVARLQVNLDSYSGKPTTIKEG